MWTVQENDISGGWYCRDEKLRCEPTTSCDGNHPTKHSALMRSVQLNLGDPVRPHGNFEHWLVRQ